MRPGQAPSSPSPRGFLRSRGDAPVSAPSRRAAAKVPPLTRRCARDHCCRDGARPGSSAHAEMRPRRSTSPPLWGRFLRSRGDAPSEAPASWCRTPVPPLTRRCAPGVVVREEPKVGSSAHAEMRPLGSRCTRSSRWFLRSRGDAPASPISAIAARWVPPLTRRCAPSGSRVASRDNGSSAHAEMRPKTGSPTNA